MKPLVIVVDDDIVLCRMMVQSLIQRQIESVGANSAHEAETLLTRMQFTHAVIDLNLGAGEPSGLMVLRHLRERQPNCLPLVLTGYASIATAVEATKLGAVQYLPKPATIIDIINAFTKHGEPIEPMISSKPMSPQRMEWEHIQRVLIDHDGNISAAARAMGIHRRSLQRKLHKRPPPH